jgi:hypothetical protein
LDSTPPHCTNTNTTFFLKKWDMRVLNGFNWLRIGPSGRVFQHCNELSVPKKGGEFLNQLKDYQLLKKDGSAWSSDSSNGSPYLGVKEGLGVSVVTMSINPVSQSFSQSVYCDGSSN